MECSFMFFPDVMVVETSQHDAICEIILAAENRLLEYPNSDC